jgi:hypothetical protein
MTRYVLTGVADPESDDGGMAEIVEIGTDDDDGMFVRIQSWSEEKSHPIIDHMRGKTIRVTIEVFDGTTGAENVSTG